MKNERTQAELIDRDLLELESYVPNLEFLAVSQALDRLEAFDPLKARIVELRFSVG